MGLVNSLFMLAMMVLTFMLGCKCGAAWTIERTRKKMLELLEDGTLVHGEAHNAILAYARQQQQRATAP